MACCGSRRAQLKVHTNEASDGQRVTMWTAAAALPQSPTRANNTPLMLRYLRRQALALRGPRTGAVYQVADASPVVVHPDDAPALLRTGLFAREDR